MEASKQALWIGRVMSGLAVLPFIPSFIMKFMGGPQIIEGMGHFGWPQSMIVPLGIVEASCVLLYLIAPTSVLGAVLLTGYLGGAMATHLRLGEPVYLHITLGLLVWGGLFLREPRLRELLPIRAKDFKYEREIVIDRPSDAVFAYIKPLKNFQGWNPFLRKDPQAKLEFRGVDGQAGFVAAWEGNREMGSGEQEIMRVLEGKQIDFELRFKKPFRATNAAYFATDSLGEGKTRMRWGMSGKAPFPMSLIGLFINCEKMIGKEFEWGLSQLKAKIEK